MKKVEYGIKVVGEEKEATVSYSPGITHTQIYALTQFLVKECYANSIDGVPDSKRIDIVDKMIADARAEALRCDF